MSGPPPAISNPHTRRALRRRWWLTWTFLILGAPVTIFLAILNFHEAARPSATANLNIYQLLAGVVLLAYTLAIVVNTLQTAALSRRLRHRPWRSFAARFDHRIIDLTSATPATAGAHRKSRPHHAHVLALTAPDGELFFVEVIDVARQTLKLLEQANGGEIWLLLADARPPGDLVRVEATVAPGAPLLTVERVPAGSYWEREFTSWFQPDAGTYRD